MECLSGYVGLRGIGPQDPESGYFVNDLPGLSTELLDRVADPDLEGAVGVWNAVQVRAQEALKKLIKASLHQRQGFRANMYQAGRMNQDIHYSGATPAPGYVGLVLIVADVDKLDVVINKLEFISHNAVENVGVVAYDANDGTKLDLLDAKGQEVHLINVVKGYNRVGFKFKPESYYDGLRVFVGLAGEVMPVLSHLYHPTKEQEGRVVPAALPFEQEVTWKNLDISGLPFFHLDYTIKCSTDKMICRNLDAFGAVYWQLLGAEIMREKIHSTRVGFFSSTNQALSQENMKHLEKLATEAIPALVEALPQDEICFDCTQKGGYYYDTNIMP